MSEYFLFLYSSSFHRIYLPTKRITYQYIYIYTIYVCLHVYMFPTDLSVPNILFQLSEGTYLKLHKPYHNFNIILFKKIKHLILIRYYTLSSEYFLFSVYIMLIYSFKL